MTNNTHITPSDLDSITFTRHATDQMAARHVTTADVAAVLTRPTITEPSRNPKNGRTQRRYVRGDLVVVFDPEARVIVTVLLRQTADWTNADVRTAMARSR